MYRHQLRLLRPRRTQLLAVCARLTRPVLIVGLCVVLLAVGCGPRPSDSADSFAWTTDLPNLAGPVGVANTAQFELRLQAQDGARANRPITLGASLRYVGPKESIEIWASGIGPVSYSFKQADGAIRIEGVSPGDCRPFQMERGQVYWLPYEKSGSFDPSGPSASFYADFFSGEELTFPAGTWVVEGRMDLSIGTCEGENVAAVASLPLTVLP